MRAQGNKVRRQRAKLLQRHESDRGTLSIPVRLTQKIAESQKSWPDFALDQLWETIFGDACNPSSNVTAA